MTEQSKDKKPPQPETHSMKDTSISQKIFSSSALMIIILCIFVLLLASFLSVMFFEPVEHRVGPLLGMSEPNQKNEILTFLGIGMGGVLVALQALMSYKRAKAMEDTANAQVEAAEQQAIANQNTENGLRQERLKNAIEHLGNASDSVRLGGAYELFHLAQDTSELRQTVLDILCAHIRRTTGEVEYRKAHQSKPSEEVQSLLTLLFVQKHDVFKGLHINLQNSWLNGANLRGARLQKANLTGVSLQKVDLDDSHLQGAILEKVQLKDAKLGNAHLEKVNLVDVHLQRADLYKTHMQGTKLLGVQLLEAHLTGVHLQRAKLKNVQMQRAHLQHVHLHGAFLQEVDLREADLTIVNMQGADISNVFMQGAKLNGAYIQGANLTNVHMEGANLASVYLQGADIAGLHLQEAYLGEVLLQGVGKQDRRPLEDNLKGQIGQQSDLSGVIFDGGLRQDEVDSLVEGLSNEKAMELRRSLKPHIGQPNSHEPPVNSGITIGSYTKEEAEKWIAEYEKAMSEVPTTNE